MPVVAAVVDSVVLLLTPVRLSPASEEVVAQLRLPLQVPPFPPLVPLLALAAVAALRTLVPLLVPR